VVWWVVASRPSVPAAAGESPAGVPATALPQPSETAEPASDAGAAEQAGDVHELLSSSSSTRSSLSDAIAGASGCHRSGVDTIEDITANRRDQLAAARTLDVTALPGGPELKRTLVDALDASYDADTAFLSWARRYLAGGCKGPVSDDRDYRRGISRSEAAQAAKSQFARSWRPIAETHGLTAWKANQI
ncbi:MAG: hypothetical protein HOV96_15370, partial [Nonomuraea sp.]|nr:hypothetical protein [Nonomuraea sp.]